MTLDSVEVTQLDDGEYRVRITEGDEVFDRTFVVERFAAAYASGQRHRLHLNFLPIPDDEEIASFT
jgi:hypothetical protein